MSLTIPNSVTVIRDWAFSENELTQVVLSEALTTLGIAAFRSNKIKNIIIPETVTSIDYWVFLDNPLEYALFQHMDASKITLLRQNSFPDKDFTVYYMPNSKGFQSFDTMQSALYGIGG